MEEKKGFIRSMKSLENSNARVKKAAIDVHSQITKLLSTLLVIYKVDFLFIRLSRKLLFVFSRDKTNRNSESCEQLVIG